MYSPSLVDRKESRGWMFREGFSEWRFSQCKHRQPFGFWRHDCHLRWFLKLWNKKPFRWMEHMSTVLWNAFLIICYFLFQNVNYLSIFFKIWNLNSLWEPGQLELELKFPLWQKHISLESILITLFPLLFYYPSLKILMRLCIFSFISGLFSLN